MLKFSRVLQNYLLWAFPLVLACMLWGVLFGKNLPSENSTGVIYILEELLSYNLMIWFLSLILFMLLLISHRDIRELTLKRISNIKDQDEREDQITGKASKRAYISTFALLIFLLFLSAFQLNIKEIPIEDRVDGKSKTLSIGMNFQLFDKAEAIQVENKNAIFEVRDLPLSKSGIILLVLGWLIVSFNWNVKKGLNGRL